MEIESIPIKVAVATGDILYHGDETCLLTAGQELVIRTKKDGSPTNLFKESVPENKVWSARILVEITETSA